MASKSIAFSFANFILTFFFFRIHVLKVFSFCSCSEKGELKVCFWFRRNFYQLESEL